MVTLNHDYVSRIVEKSHSGFRRRTSRSAYPRFSGARVGYRFYDNKVGRWTTVDPVGIAGGLNCYEFVGDDPANRVDPFGLIDCPGLLQRINRTYALFQNLSGALNESLRYQQRSLNQTYALDVAFGAMITMGLAAGGSLLELALEGEPIMQGASLGVDLARSGAVTGEIGSGAGAVIGQVIEHSGGLVAEGVVERNTTGRIKHTNQQSVDLLNATIADIRARLSNLRFLYRRCCM